MTTLTFSTGDQFMIQSYSEAGFNFSTPGYYSFDLSGQKLVTENAGEEISIVKGGTFSLNSLKIDGAYNFGNDDTGELLTVGVTAYRQNAQVGHVDLHLDGTSGFQTFGIGGAGFDAADEIVITAPNFNFLYIDDIVLDAPAPLTAASHILADAYGALASLTTAQLTAGATGAQGPLSVSSLGTAQHGTVTLDSTGHAVYTPYVGYVGGDSFAYTLGDGTGAQASSTVAVTVSGPGGAATAPSYIYGPSYGVGRTFDVSGDGIGHQVLGTTGADVIYGGGQADSLNGNTGDDLIFGGGGNDVITGGAGADSVTGGAGQDNFVIAKADLAPGFGVGAHLDEIMDFEGAGDGFHAGAGDVITLNGFGAGATLALDAAATAASSDPTAHYYTITGAGGYTGELIVHYVGSAVLVAGDYGFH